MNRKKEIISWAKTIVLAFVIAFIIRNHVFALYVVDGHSMQPTLDDGQILMVNNFRYKFAEPQRGEIVVFLLPEVATGRGNWLVGTDALVKRVIGIPGDSIEIQGGNVLVNGEALKEDYVDVELHEPFGPIIVKSGELFVLGDNRHPGRSEDSRRFGTIPIGSVIGRASYIILPSPQKVH